MEENKLQKKNKKLSLSMLVCLSLVVFSVFAALCYGIFKLDGGTKESYAIDPANQFDLKLKKSGGAPVFLYGVDESGSNTFPVTQFFANSVNGGTKVFCIEHRMPVDDATYTKDSTVTVRDEALLYMLRSWRSIPDVSENVQTWIAQVAIWSYLHNKDFSDAAHTSSPNNIVQACEFDDADIDFNNEDDVVKLTRCKNYIPSLERRAILNTTGVREGQNGNVESCNGNCYDKVIQYIEKAMAWQNSGYLKITGVSDEGMARVDDYFVSNLTVYKDGAIRDYSISVIDVEGNTITDLASAGISLLDGNTNTEITDLTGVTTGRIKVRIDANKVPVNGQVQFSLKFTGSFTALSGEYYAAGATAQKVISVEGGTSHQDVEVRLTAVRAPDTGMTTAQTIYFIGLIVLLCGVGIVYANTKNVEIRQ